ncbi:metal transporter Nramp3-like protein, partial [Tanacetum coccineum]
FIFLFLENYGVRKLEALFAVLIAVMAISFAWMFGETKPNVKELLIGLVVPKLNSKTIQQAVGIVGCIIMPHNVFLHSALVQSREIDPRKTGRVREAIKYYSIESAIALAISFIINLFVIAVFAKAFFGTSVADNIGLGNAGQLLQEKFGGGFFPILYIWAIGLLAAGQSSTITGTYAGQFIMGGFLDLRLKKWARALITRSCAIIPTLIVALIFDSSEETLDALNEWLNVLQSVQIPFALIPLLCLVAKDDLMGVFKIGPVLKTVSWLVAALVMAINAYLLQQFIAEEVSGVAYTSLVIVFTVAYAAFVVYLIWRSITVSTFSFLKARNQGVGVRKMIKTLGPYLYDNAAYRMHILGTAVRMPLKDGGCLDHHRNIVVSLSHLDLEVLVGLATLVCLALLGYTIMWPPISSSHVATGDTVYRINSGSPG